MVKPDEFWTLVIENPGITPSRQRKLDALEEYLKSIDTFTTDPIDFLKTHYEWSEQLWIEAKSVPQLWRMVKDKGINYATSDGLHKMLSGLWITFRPHTEQTSEWRKSLQRNQSNQKTMSENLDKFNTALRKVVWEQHETAIYSFDEDQYKSIWKTIDKVLYLLNLDKENIWAISTISSLRWQAIMTAINTLLAEIIWELQKQWFELDSLTISKWSINNLLAKLNS